jgi:hypothetical protein
MSRPFDERPFLILCEGESDKRFFDKLIEKRKIENSFQVYFPSRGNDKRAGRSKFGTWLDVASVSEEFIENIKAVLIVSDNDSEPAKSLEELKEALKSAPAFAIPNKAQEVAAPQRDVPPLVILMVPIGGVGGLETLCLTAAYEKWPLKTAVDTFMSETAARNWTVGKQSKMQLQCVIAATCAPRPDAGFVGHWWERDEYHIPLDHPIFDGIAEFLGNFRGMIESASGPSVNAASAARSA